MTGRRGQDDNGHNALTLDITHWTRSGHCAIVEWTQWLMALGRPAETITGKHAAKTNDVTCHVTWTDGHRLNDVRVNKPHIAVSPSAARWLTQ